MQKKIAFLAGILLCIFSIIVGYFWATKMMDSIYAYHSPLHNANIIPGKAIGNPLSRSVVVVLIDGLRYDTSLNPTVMPYLNQLRSTGANALMHSRPPSYSQPGYAVLLTGAWPDLNDAPLINLDYADIPTFTQDDIFTAAHRAGLQTAISGYNWFEKLIPQESISASFYTPGEDQFADRQVTDAATPWLKEGKYQLVLIHLDQVDYAGHHEGGPIDPRWNEAAKRSDDLLKEIVASMDLAQDTLLVVSDHGHIDRGGHGGQDAVTLKEPFLLLGKNVVKGEYADVQMVDVAPTISALLGTNIPGTSQGQPRIEMLDLPISQIDLINSAVKIQQKNLAIKYGEAINKTISISSASNIVLATQNGMNEAMVSRLSNERIQRGIIGIVFLIVIINLALAYIRPHTLWIIAGIVVYWIIFNLKYVFIDHKTYSLSSVVSSTSLIFSTVITTIIAVSISWILVFIGMRAYRMTAFYASEATLKFVLAVITSLTLPVGIHYVVNGAFVTWALPNFLLNFIGLLSLIQILASAALGLIFIGISAIIGALSTHGTKYEAKYQVI